VLRVFSNIIDGCLRPDTTHFEDLLDWISSIEEDDLIKVKNECVKAIKYIQEEKLVELF
jgi:hypothetical protein